MAQSKMSFKDKFCTKRNYEQNFDLFVPKTRRTYNNEKTQIRKFEIGAHVEGTEEKILIVFGATGSGKSTLLNGMFNYIVGVNWEDGYRLKLIEETAGGKSNQAKSQTQWITAYTIHHQPGFRVDYTLTIIDTPGFGDTDGIEKDVTITNQIREFVTSAASFGISQIDAVGFVATSALPRLTQAQKYIYHSILALFGKDIVDNIFMLLTFSDGGHPEVLPALKKAGVPFQDLYKFNNCGLYIYPAKAKKMNQMFWEMGIESYQEFLDHMEEVEPKTLRLTEEVLKQRRQLQVGIDGIVKRLHDSMDIVQQFQSEKAAFEKYEAKKTTRTFTVKKKVNVKLDTEGCNTNCKNCNETCHANCLVLLNMLTFTCSAMDWSFNCRVCGCPSSAHQNDKFLYETKMVEETMTIEELSQRFEEVDYRNDLSSIIAIYNKKIDEEESKSLELIEKAYACHIKLQEIALKPSAPVTAAYIDVLVASEEKAGGSNAVARIQKLKELKVKAEYSEGIVENKEKQQKELRDRFKQLKLK